MRYLLLVFLIAATMAGPTVGAPAPDTLLLDDFEGESRWDGVALSSERAHGGKHAGRWANLNEHQNAVLRGVPGDWSRYDRLCFWLYSAKANGQGLTLLLNSDNPADTEGWDYYFTHFRVDWEGWRFFSLRLGEDVQASRRPRGWDHIEGMSLNSGGWGHQPLPDTDLFLDDVLLVRDPVAASTLRSETRLQEGTLIAETVLKVTNRSAAPRAFPLAYGRKDLRAFRLDAPSTTPTIPAGGSAEVAIRLSLPAQAREEALPLTRESVIMKIAGSEGEAAPLVVEVGASVPLPDRPHPRLFATAAELAAVRARAERLPWAKAVYERVLDAAGKALEGPLDIPDKGGQWPHHYACPKHGRSLKTLSPTQHQCPVDGQILTGWPYDDVVISSRHGRNAGRVVDLGLAFQWTGDRRFAERSAAIYREYARKYPDYPIHDARGRDTRSGARMYAQTLDEAVDLISFAWGYDLIAGSNVLTDADRNEIEERFLRGAARVIQRNNAGISNWQSWHNAGVGAVGFALNDPSLAGWALNGPSGLLSQLSQSVLPDGWWYEGAPAYHFYALAALVRLAEAARAAGTDVWRQPAMKRLFDAPLLYTYPDLRFPAVNDSDVFSLQGEASLYEIAYARLHDDRYLPLLAGERKSREALLWGAEDVAPKGPATPLASHQFQGVGAAVLRAGEGPDATYVHLDYGAHGGGHGHPDKLTLVLFALGRELAPDPGRLAYSVPAHGSWYRQSIAHSTLIVDATSQSPTEGSLPLFATGGALQVMSGLSEGAYEGVALRHTVALVAVPGRAAPPYLVDFSTAMAKEERTFDWALHNRGELRCGEAAEAPAPGDKHGYQHLAKPRRAADPGAPVDWVLPEGSVRLWSVLPPAERILAEGMGQPPSEVVPVVLDRTRGTQALFARVIEPYRGQPAIRSVRLLDVTLDGKPAPDGSALAIEVDRGEEKDVIILAPGLKGIKAAAGVATTREAVLLVRRAGADALREEK